MNAPMTAPRNLRLAMPLVTAFIDDLREAFGADAINAIVKRGMAGLPVFHACENGVEVGTRAPEPHPSKVVAGRDIHLQANPKVTK